MLVIINAKFLFAKIVFSIITIIFATLGLLKVFSYDITHPIMFTSLATVLLLRSIEYKNNNDKSGFVLTVLTALFVYIVVIYNVFMYLHLLPEKI